jgi:UDP-N-acetylglucosamine 2-epimerase (non-hydrolysing)
MEAGNRSFDERVPEEINRRIVDHISDINMPLTEHARRYLIDEGIRPETIIKIGSCMEEVIDYYMPKIEKSDICNDLGIQSNNYFLVSAHREENVDKPDRLLGLLESLNSLVDTYNIPIIFSVHPRTRKRLDDIDTIEINKNIRFMKALGFLDYIKLQMNAKCVISDSGTIAEETSLLNIPSITLRQAHERPEGMDEGTLIMCDLEKVKVLNAVETILSQYNFSHPTTKQVEDYNGGKVSIKVSRIIQSYTDYINRTVWRES